jgi:hypothetical protein
MAASAAVAHGTVVSVGTAASTTSLGLSAGRVTYGDEQAETLSVVVAPAGGSGTPTGSVTVTSGAASVCDIILSSSGTGSCVLPATRLAAGTVNLTAEYSGDADFGPSVSGAKALAVSKAATTTVLTLSHATIPYGDESGARISVAIRPRYSGTPSGTVTVKAGPTMICKITLKSARGSCSLAKTRLTAKPVKLTAGYSGSADFGSSGSGAKTLTVSKSSSTTALTLSKAGAQYGSEQGEKISVKVTPKFSGSLTGTVTVKAGGTTVAVIRLSSGNGGYTFSSKKLPAGRYTVVATYSGNADYMGSRSAGKSLTVSVPPPSKPACYPLSNEGTCYEPGEYCRDDDHGAHGIAGNGEAIVCEDNDGWRWEPVN